MKPEFTVRARIQKPIDVVFEAVRDPNQLSRYFTTGSASGPLTEGTTVTWRFADYPEAVEVRVVKVRENDSIQFVWEAGPDHDTTVTMTFEQLSEAETLVSIHETGWAADPKGLERSYDNCEGWTQMVASLKAWLEHGINLRESYYPVVEPG